MILFKLYNFTTQKMLNYIKHVEKINGTECFYINSMLMKNMMLKKEKNAQIVKNNYIKNKVNKIKQWKKSIIKSL